jgi:hypothetical protein
VQASPPTTPLKVEGMPAPVQGVVYRDGTWAATGPNFMDRSASRMSVEFSERGPLKVVAQVSYVYERPEGLHRYRDGATGEDREHRYPAGEGFYRSTITVQTWKAHTTAGIDCDVYTIADEDQHAHIGNWAHAWHPSPEAAQFRETNDRPFEERQHILRIRGREGFKVLIAPYFKGKGWGDAAVSRDGELLVVSAAGDTTRIARSWHACQSDGKQAFATLGTAAAEHAGIRIEGGPTEVVIENGKAVITAHGAKGLRRVRLPGRWEAKAPLERRGDTYLLDYAGGKPEAIVLGR